MTKIFMKKQFKMKKKIYKRIMRINNQKMKMLNRLKKVNKINKIRIQKMNNKI